jgi:hypothetical protein
MTAFDYYGSEDFGPTVARYLLARKTVLGIQKTSSSYWYMLGFTLFTGHEGP